MTRKDIEQAEDAIAHIGKLLPALKELMRKIAREEITSIIDEGEFAEMIEEAVQHRLDDAVKKVKLKRPVGRPTKGGVTTRSTPRYATKLKAEYRGNYVVFRPPSEEEEVPPEEEPQEEPGEELEVVPDVR